MEKLKLLSSSVKKALNDKIRYPKRVVIWTAIMAVGFVALLFQMWRTHGWALQNLTYRPATDTFYDFTTSVINGWDRQDYAGMYPPLVQIFFHAIACVIPNFNSEWKVFELINSPLGALYTLFFLMGCALLIGWLFQDHLKTANWLQRTAVVLLFLSAPYIYGWQRANVLFLVVPLIMFFGLYYDSDNVILRTLASLALAFAAGIKLYPAILGLMLVIEKRWKQTVGCLILGVSSLVVPAFYFDGFNTIKLVFERLFFTSGEYDNRGVGHQLSLSNFVEMINQGLGVNINASVVMIAMLLVMAIGFIFTTKRWQRFTILTVAMIIIPSLSFQYTMILMAFPLLMYFKEEHPFTKWDYIYISLFASLFFVVPMGGQNAFAFTENQYYALNYSTVLENIGINLLLIVICVEAIINFIKTKKQNRYNLSLEEL